VFKDPIFQSNLDSIVNTYINSTDPNADDVLKADLNDLIMSNTELKMFMKENNITHL